MVDVTAQGYNETNVPSENCKDALQLQAYWVQEVNFFFFFFFILWAEEVVWDKCDESLKKVGVCVNWIFPDWGWLNSPKKGMNWLDISDAIVSCPRSYPGRVHGLQSTDA